MLSRDHRIDEERPKLNNRITKVVARARFKPGAGTCSCGALIERYWVIHVDGKTIICLACHQDKGSADAEPDFD
jgi:hypothetical protein